MTMTMTTTNQVLVSNLERRIQKNEGNLAFSHGVNEDHKASELGFLFLGVGFDDKPEYPSVG